MDIEIDIIFVCVFYLELAPEWETIFTLFGREPFPMKLAPNWPEKPDEKAIKRYGGWNLPIQIVQIPTYAPWCNHIEKLWKLFRQDFLHVHRFCDDLETLRAKAQQFFDRFAQGSTELLQYV